MPEKDYKGFELSTESYYIENDKWKVNDNCRLEPAFSQLEALYDTLEDTTRKLKTGELERKTGVKIIRDTSKSILEKTLFGFNYESALKNHGYLALDSIAMDMIHTFLRVGSIKEMKRVSKLVEEMRNGSNGSQD